MVRHQNGAECRTCTRPFDVYRWTSDAIAKQSSKTLICLTCARERDCCQLCMLDIHFNIPLHIRDAALRMAGLTASDLGRLLKNRELQAVNADEAQEKQGHSEDIALEHKEKARQLLSKLSKKLGTQIFEKAKPAVRNDLTSKGVDITKIVSQLPFNALLENEKHPGLSSFFVFGALDKAPQYIISEWCGQFGAIKNLSISNAAKCAFITFVKHGDAVAFAEATRSSALNRSSNSTTAALILLDKKYPVRVAWGAPVSMGRSNEEHRKLSLVVDRVMKQLAEKDKGASATENIKTKDRETTKKLTKGRLPSDRTFDGSRGSHHSDGSQYASLATDFEL